MRQEAIKQAEKERRDKYKKQEEEREVLRQGIREKVGPDYIGCSLYGQVAYYYKTFRTLSWPEL